MDITQLLAFAVQNKASDLHLSGKSPPILRVNGELRRLQAEPLTGNGIRDMVFAVMTDQQRALYERDKEIDFAIALGADARFRVNAFTNSNGSAAVFRTIPTKVPSLEDLGGPSIFRRFAELKKGLVLVTGPTGSGKSTTLAAIVDHINTHSSRHILTIEDPVEFVHQSKMSLVNHREVGRDTESFARALRSALREDPDVILVGEMRDHETISLALTAAETGHLVMGTLHTSSAAKTIDCIIDVFPAGDKEMVRSMTSGSIQAIVAQVLLKRADGQGRVAAHEIMVGTPAIRNLIRENKVAQIYSMIQMGQRFGMQTLQDTVGNLLRKGLITQEEANHALQVASGDDDVSSGNAAAPAPGKPAPAARAPGVPLKGAPQGDRPEDGGEGYSF